MTDSGADCGTANRNTYNNNSSHNESLDDSINETEAKKQEAVVPVKNFEMATVNLSLSTRFTQQEYLDESEILSIQESLRKHLNIHLNPTFKLRPDLNMSQRFRPIVHSEQELIEECLMLMSGLKANLLFKPTPEGMFVLNPRYRLVYLHRELEECLSKVAHYATTVVKIESFMCNTNYDESTQTYEAFIQAIAEFMKYYKTTLHQIATTLNKKENKFTLVDFLNHIRETYFVYLDLLTEFINQIERDKKKHASEKSINLLVIIHRFLVARCFSSRIDRVARFLLWLFVRTLMPYLRLIDDFIHESVLLDSRNELGFKRNPAISVAHLQYLKSGFDILMPKVSNFPSFARIILSSSFKICKYMEVVKLLENVNRDADISENFLAQIKNLCPSLILERENHIVTQSQTSPPISFLEINFDKIKNQPVNKPKDTELKWSIVRIDTLLESANEIQIDFNIESQLETILAEVFMKYVNYSSSVLITNLLDRFNLRKFFAFLQSYYLFKSNEIMFLFSKSLFDLVKRLEVYQDDAILNSLLFHSVNAVFTTDSLAKNVVFNAANLVTIHYDRAMDEKHQALMHKIRNVDGISRLIGDIRIDVKICWPLNVVISQPNLDIYNRLFVFMMQLKQAKYDLDSLRVQDMELPKKHQLDEASVKKMFLLRFKLMNFMNNAHDLICNQIYEITEEFMKRLDQKKDIDEIVELHDKFLVRLVKSCLLGVNAIQNSFLRIFMWILEFCDLWRRGIGFFTSKNQSYVEDIEKNIGENFSFAHVLLGQISNKVHSTYLQLLVSVLE